MEEKSLLPSVVIRFWWNFDCSFGISKKINISKIYIQSNKLLWLVCYTLLWFLIASQKYKTKDDNKNPTLR